MEPFDAMFSQLRAMDAEEARLDATLSRLRAEPLTVATIMEAENLLDAVRADEAARLAVEGEQIGEAA